MRREAYPLGWESYTLSSADFSQANWKKSVLFLAWEAAQSHWLAQLERANSEVSSGSVIVGKSSRYAMQFVRPT